jgi:hypothetical protein
MLPTFLPTIQQSQCRLRSSQAAGSTQGPRSNRSTRAQSFRAAAINARPPDRRNPLDDWTSSVEDKSNTNRRWRHLALVPDMWTASLLGRCQKVNGFNDLFAPQGGAPYNARSGA